MAPLGLTEKRARLDDLESQATNEAAVWMGRQAQIKKLLSSNAILPGNEPRQMELGWLGDGDI